MSVKESSFGTIHRAMSADRTEGCSAIVELGMATHCSSHPPVNPARFKPALMYGFVRMTRHTSPER